MRVDGCALIVVCYALIVDCCLLSVDCDGWLLSLACLRCFVVVLVVVWFLSFSSAVAWRLLW